MDLFGGSEFFFEFFGDGEVLEFLKDLTHLLWPQSELVFRLDELIIAMVFDELLDVVAELG